MPFYGEIDGQWVELEKDCGCLPKFHEGPHWIHSDAIWRESNKKLLERKDVLALFGFAQEEAARCREKLYQMESRRINAYRFELTQAMKTKFPELAEIRPTFQKPREL